MNILVIVDPQNDFIQGPLQAHNSKETVQNISNYIKNTPKTTYDKIFVTMDTHASNYLDTREGEQLPIPHCERKSFGWQVDNRITEALRTYNVTFALSFIEKNTFGSLDLMNQIERMATNTYINDRALTIDFCGFDTDICVINNALLARAYFPEAQINVIENLCAGSSADMHSKAIDVMKSCHINAITKDTENDQCE